MGLSARTGVNEHVDIQYTADLVITGYSGYFEQPAYRLPLWLRTKPPVRITLTIGIDIPAQRNRPTLPPK